MRGLRSQEGFTLAEVLAALTLFVVVLIPTLTALESFTANSAASDRRNDAQDQARTATDRLARQLRNLASPTVTDTRSIDRAGPYDLIFKTTDPARRRVRYCLDGARNLWQHTQSFALGVTDPGLPATTACPAAVSASGWASAQVVVGHVVNRVPGDRPVFHYGGFDGAETSTITAVRSQLFLDADERAEPGETSLGTGVFLRNQNQRPRIPDFSLVQSPPGSRTFAMNGSPATDPEGRTLEYLWYEGTTPLGRGLTLSHTFAGSGVRSVTLRVVDPGGLAATLTKQTPALP